MGKYRKSIRVKEKKREQHPIWRGIGCLIIIIVPVLSYVTALVTFPLYYQAGLVPNDLLGTPQVPTWMWYSPNLAGFVQAIIGQANLKAMLLLAFVYMLILGGLMSLIYALIYRYFGPPKYGPTDAPPIRAKKVKKYTR
jgi:hypothetical protein